MWTLVGIQVLIQEKNVLLSDTGNWKGFPGDLWFIDVRPLAISVEVSGSAGIGFGGKRWNGNSYC